MGIPPPAILLAGEGDWDGYGGIKVLQINDPFIVEWEVNDWVSSYPAVIKLDGNSLAPNMVPIPLVAPDAEFKRIKKDSSEDLEFYLNSGFIILTPTKNGNFINAQVKDFFVPGRYEHNV